MDEITKVFCSNGCKPLVRMFNGNLTFCSFSSGFCQNFHGPYVCFTSFHRDGQSIILLQSTCIALWKCCIVSNREYPYGVTDIVRQQGATRDQNTLQYGDKQWSHTRINISEESFWPRRWTMLNEWAYSHHCLWRWQYASLSNGKCVA